MLKNCKVVCITDDCFYVFLSTYWSTFVSWIFTSMQILMGSRTYIWARKWENCTNFFTQNVLLFQENCNKIASSGNYCTDSEICHNCAKIALRNFTLFWWVYLNHTIPQHHHSIFWAASLVICYPLPDPSSSSSDVNHQYSNMHGQIAGVFFL